MLKPTRLEVSCISRPVPTDIYSFHDKFRLALSKINDPLIFDFLLAGHFQKEERNCHLLCLQDLGLGFHPLTPFIHPLNSTVDAHLSLDPLFPPLSTCVCSSLCSIAAPLLSFYPLFRFLPNSVLFPPHLVGFCIPIDFPISRSISSCVLDSSPVLSFIKSNGLSDLV
ncbi:hypothetical protein VNO77_44029 [Canavalia gladiata]|uniref:Uncharacterized protein n=1 Tax=Canavalia gladiata TaxID=3824 RepID=A0AAN9PQ02_CANGL